MPLQPATPLSCGHAGILLCTSWTPYEYLWTIGLLGFLAALRTREQGDVFRFALPPRADDQALQSERNEDIPALDQDVREEASFKKSDDSEGRSSPDAREESLEFLTPCCSFVPASCSFRSKDPHLLKATRTHSTPQLISSMRCLRRVM